MIAPMIMMMMNLEIGKYYKDKNGLYISVIAQSDTIQWGKCYIVESSQDPIGLVPLQLAEDDEWEEISEIEWDEQFEGF